MKKNLLAVMALLMCSFPAFAGAGESSGGGYQYSDTTSKHIYFIQTNIIRYLSGITDQQFQSIVSEYTNLPVDRVQFKEVIRNLKQAPLLNKTRINKDGFEVPLDMDYADGAIITLQPFYAKYDHLKLTLDEQKEMIRKLFHEATHIFGIGIDNDDLSKKLSRALMGKMWVNRVYYNGSTCGWDGDVDQRIADCVNDENNISLVSDKGQYQIYDTRPMLKQLVAFTVEKAVLEDKDPTVACSKMDSMNGQVQWRAPISAQEITQVMKLLSLYSVDGDFLLTAKKWYQLGSNFRIMCFGTVAAK